MILRGYFERLAFLVGKCTPKYKQPLKRKYERSKGFQKIELFQISYAEMLKKIKKCWELLGQQAIHGVFEIATPKLT